jgi:SAM-dependent methyltransferase
MSAMGIIHSKDKGDDRPFDRILYHYQVERELSDRLRKATGTERKALYATVYDELYRLIPDHPKFKEKEKPDLQRVRVFSQFNFVRRFLRSESTFLEVGAGDCALTTEVAKHVMKAFAFDVSQEITRGIILPANTSLVISKEGEIPFDRESIDITFSSDVMEHLHPEDAYEQLEAIYAALKPSGLYVCHTPNRLTGPWDISKYFDDVSTCLHLHEYTVRELDGLFKKVGFTRTCYYAEGRGKFIRFPIFIAKIIENLLEAMPLSVRRLLTRTLLFKALLGANIVGVKKTDCGTRLISAVFTVFLW